MSAILTCSKCGVKHIDLPLRHVCPERAPGSEVAAANPAACQSKDCSWRSVADGLAEALKEITIYLPTYSGERFNCEAALERYEQEKGQRR